MNTVTLFWSGTSTAATASFVPEGLLFLIDWAAAFSPAGVNDQYFAACVGFTSPDIGLMNGTVNPPNRMDGIWSWIIARHGFLAGTTNAISDTSISKTVPTRIRIHPSTQVYLTGQANQSARIYCVLHIE